MDKVLEKVLQSKRSHEQPEHFDSRSRIPARLRNRVVKGKCFRGKLIVPTSNLESIPILSCVTRFLEVLLELESNKPDLQRCLNIRNKTCILRRIPFLEERQDANLFLQPMLF